MLTVAQLKSLLRSEDVRLTKRLGQHHLIDERLIAELMTRWTLAPQDTVVEIGSGLGALTEPLAQRAGRVIAVEVDRRICALLCERMSHLPRVTVVCEDILQFRWQMPEAPVVVVGAIPYSITSPVLIMLCEHRHAIRDAFLIVQQEIAQRLAAAPGTKAYGRLSILVQYGWEVRQIMSVPRGAFFPQPTVDSTCVHLQNRLQPSVAVKDETQFFALVKAAFGQRRKSLLNCLKTLPGKPPTRAALEEFLTQTLQVPPQVRGEALSLSQFALLSNFITS